MNVQGPRQARANFQLSTVTFNFKLSTKVQYHYLSTVFTNVQDILADDNLQTSGDL